MGPRPSLETKRDQYARLIAAASERPRVAAAVAGVLAALLGTALGGLVAGLIVAAYIGLGVLRVLRGQHTRADRAARTAAIDAVGLLAADLRAGVAGNDALAASGGLDRSTGPLSTVDIRASVAAAVELAERTGAPLADLLDRLDTELRSARRAEEAARAQVSGARASALLLAALPVAGVALGYGLGADPLRILLHTGLGALCAAGAVTLQLAGLAWSDRLVAPPDQRSHVDIRRGTAGSGRRADPHPSLTAHHLAASAAAGIGAGLLAGGWLGVVLAMLVTVAAYWWLDGRPAPAEVAQRRQIAAALPYAADLMGSVLAAGAPPQSAAGQVGQALGGALGQRLRQVERDLAGGAPPEQAWAYLGDVEGAALLVRAATRSQHSGAALAAALRRLADELRARRLAEADAAARRAGVLAVLPLGLCFLPAFVLAGLVPVVVAVLGDVLST
jgi:Flp pilus assembly protein TadB